MSATAVRPMTTAEFLDWEDRQSLRYEFDGFQPIAMAGGTYAHTAIQMNLAFSLVGRLRGNPCRPCGNDLKVEVAGRIRYPDAFVVCTPIGPETKLVRDPVVVFEVLSDSSVHEDMVVKNAEYRATPSVRRYVILHQTRIGAVAFSRKGDDWVAEIVSRDGVLRLPEIGIELPMSEIYADVELDEPPEAG